MGENKRVITKWLYWFVFAVAVILVYKTVDNLGEILNWFGKLFSILMPFVIGILIAYLFYMPTKKLEKVYSKTKNKFIKRKSRAIAIFTIYVIAIIAIIFIINFIIPTIIESTKDLISNFQSYYNKTMAVLNNLPEESFLKNEIIYKLAEQIKNIDVSEMKNLCFEFLKDKISKDTFRFFQINLPLPEIFRRENPDIDEVILGNSFIPDEVIERYFNKKLKLQDLIDYSYVFRKISVNGFLEDKVLSDISIFINDNYGFGKFQELVHKHPDVFEHIFQSQYRYEFGTLLLTGRKDLESSFIIAVKNYFLDYYMPKKYKTKSDRQIFYNVPEWLSSMNFQFVDKIESVNDLMQYNESVVVFDENQRYALDQLNIENIRKFERETGILSHNEWFEELEIFNKSNIINNNYMNIRIIE